MRISIGFGDHRATSITWRLEDENVPVVLGNGPMTHMAAGDRRLI